MKTINGYDINLDSGFYFMGQLHDEDSRNYDEVVDQTPGIVPTDKPQYQIVFTRHLLLKILANMEWEDQVQFTFFEPDQPVLIAGEETFALLMPAKKEDPLANLRWIDVQIWAAKEGDET